MNVSVVCGTGRCTEILPNCTTIWRTNVIDLYFRMVNGKAQPDEIQTLCEWAFNGYSSFRLWPHLHYEALIRRVLVYRLQWHSSSSLYLAFVTHTSSWFDVCLTCACWMLAKCLQYQTCFILQTFIDKLKQCLTSWLNKLTVCVKMYKN